MCHQDTHDDAHLAHDIVAMLMQQRRVPTAQ